MLLSRHIIVSLPLGATVGFFTQSAFAGLLCFLSGVLIDVDHLLDYVIHHGLKTFNFKKIYQACANLASREEEGGVKKLYIIFHAGEIAILLWIAYTFSKSLYLLSIALGYTGHLILDAVGNSKKIETSTYFMSSRLKKGFNTNKLIK